MICILGICCFVYYVLLKKNINYVDRIWIWNVMGIVLILLVFIDSYTKQVLRMVLSIICLTVLVILVAIVVFVYKKGKDTVTGKEKTILVLAGGFNKTGQLSSTTKKRLEKTLEIVEDSTEVVFVLSGGLVSNGQTEAICMSKYLMEQGVREEQIVLEENSRDTGENLKNSYLMIKNADTLLIVSSRFHLWRIQCLAKMQGYPKCNYAGADADWLLQPHYYLREICAMLREILLGRL